MRWHDGETIWQLVESVDELHLSVIRTGTEKPVAVYGRGQIRSIIDMHSTGTCTLRVHGDDGAEHQIGCPPGICVVLMVKLRKFQGANPEAALPEDKLLASETS